MKGEHGLSKHRFKGVTTGNSDIADGKVVVGNLITDRFHAVIVTAGFSTTGVEGVIELDHCFYVDPSTVELFTPHSGLTV